MDSVSSPARRRYWAQRQYWTREGFALRQYIMTTRSPNSHWSCRKWSTQSQASLHDDNSTIVQRMVSTVRTSTSVVKKNTAFLSLTDSCQFVDQVAMGCLLLGIRVNHLFTGCTLHSDNPVLCTMIFLADQVLWNSDDRITAIPHSYHPPAVAYRYTWIWSNYMNFVCKFLHIIGVKPDILILRSWDLASLPL